MDEKQKMMLCVVVMLGAIAVPYSCTTWAALLFISIMYSEKLSKNMVDIINAINETDKKQ
jgi:hypothetical protein